MGRYALLCTVDPGKLDLLARLRAEHYAFLIVHHDRIVFGGPTRACDGGPPETMIMIIDADSPDDAEAFIARESYTAHGGFSRVVIRPWSQVIPEAHAGDLQRTLDAERTRGQ